MPLSERNGINQNSLQETTHAWLYFDLLQVLKREHLIIFVSVVDLISACTVPRREADELGFLPISIEMHMDCALPDQTNCYIRLRYGSLLRHH